ncbi:MAG TPA: tetratricopeptide repeat protein [Casimicrobiaceae bacterium]|jgi:tetratricopeptide (TPR) repeat protein
MDISAVLRRKPCWRTPAATAIVLAITIACAPAVCAQKADNDYYTNTDAALLRSVEKYHVIRAEDEIRSKYYAPARADLDFALRYFPNHPRGLLLLVQLCSEYKQQGCDLDLIFERAIAVNPNAVGTYITQGVYLHRVKRYSDAVKSYQRALELDHDSMNAHYNIALAYLELKEYDRANEHAQRAYALGAPVPGLRERLKHLGRWRPAEETPASPRAAAPTGSDMNPAVAAPAEKQPN